MQITGTIKIAPNKFSESEERESKRLTDLQRAGIENIIIECMNEKLQLTVTNFSGTDGFLLQHEYLRGQIGILQYLLALDETTKESREAKE